MDIFGIKKAKLRTWNGKITGKHYSRTKESFSTWKNEKK